MDPFAIGISANYTYTNGGNSVGVSAGIGALGGPYANVGASHTMGDLNLSAGAGVGDNYAGWNGSATYKGYGPGYGQTYYGNATGPDGKSNAQTVGSITALWDGGSFTIQNDAQYFADGNDRWRTNAWELTIGDFSVGSYLYTNSGEKASTEIDSEKPTYDGISPIWGENHNKKRGFTAWKDGRVYSAPIWIGLRTGNRIERIGYSFRASQDLQQNGIHSRTKFGNQNYYLNYQDFRTGIYLYTGYYNPFSLWGH